MQILLLGATGRTGKLVLAKALETGYRVHVLSRNTERIQKRQGLKIFEGNPANQEDLEKALSGCDAIVSVLNISRKSDFPWSKLRTPKHFLSDVMKLLVPLAEEKEVSRITVCSAWGVADTKDDLPGWFRWFIENSNIGVAYADHEIQEKILESSPLKWTIVRPVGLTNSTKQQKITESFKNTPKPGLTISRRSVADYMVESLNRDDLIGQKVVISGK